MKKYTICYSFAFDIEADDMHEAKQIAAEQILENYKAIDFNHCGMLAEFDWIADQDGNLLDYYDNRDYWLDKGPPSNEEI
jgi:hypothetical protein